MNRRNFFKVVTGFVAGIFAGSAKSNEDFPIPADPLKDKFVLNHIQRLNIEAAKKAANPLVYIQMTYTSGDTASTKVEYLVWGIGEDGKKVLIDNVQTT
jgi:hypothetical protein